MQTPLEISIDLTAQDLLTPPTLDSIVEVEDVCAVDPLLNAKGAANADAAPAVALEDSIEIELTAEQMDALLEGLLSV